jgi:hypothetical protein
MPYPPPAAKDPTWEWLEHQLAWYDRKSSNNQRYYKRLKLLELAVAAALPVVAGAGSPVWVTGGLAAVIACWKAPSTSTSSGALDHLPHHRRGPQARTLPVLGQGRASPWWPDPTLVRTGTGSCGADRRADLPEAAK